jgi:hypothetical protein
MNNTWNTLERKALNAKANRVCQYARQMHDVEDASDLDDLLNGIEPASAAKMLEDARKDVEDGADLHAAVRLLGAKFRKPNGSEDDKKAAKKLHAILTHALSKGVSLGEAAAHVAKQVEDVPGRDETEVIRMQAAGEAIKYARIHGHRQPEHLRFGRREVNLAGSLIARRKGLTFERAIDLVRTGK